jgi:hypothetical protein
MFLGLCWEGWLILLEAIGWFKEVFECFLGCWGCWESWES